MKKRYYIIALTAILSSACADLMDDSVNPSTGKGLEVAATIEDVETRTHLDGVDMYWDEGDAINVAIDPDFTTKVVTLSTFNMASGANEKTAVFKSETAEPGSSYCAAYPATSYVKTGEKYIYYDFPIVQDYVQNGIKNGYVPMFAPLTDDPSKLKFMYGSGVVRLNLYDTDADSPAKITKIEVTTDTPASGLMVASNINRFPFARDMKNKQYTITYNVPEVQLSSNSSAPTSFHICLANSKSNGANLCTNGVYASIKYTIYSSDGRIFTKEKNNQIIEGGKIYNMPAIAFEGVYTYTVGDYYPNPNVDIKDATAVAAIEGLVYEVSEDGLHGKMISLVEGSSLKWNTTGAADNTDNKDNGAENFKTIIAKDPTLESYPAFAWCASLGDGWYIPAINEVVALRTAWGLTNAEKDAFNAKLTAIGATPLSASKYVEAKGKDQNAYYYSSTEDASASQKVLSSSFANNDSAPASGLKKSSDTQENLLFRAIKTF